MKLIKPIHLCSFIKSVSVLVVLALLFISSVLTIVQAQGVPGVVTQSIVANKSSRFTSPTRGDLQSDLRFTHLTTDDGLSQNSIYAILQDHLGFMWFATQDGLNRYDGNTFVVYKHNPNDPGTISSNYIQDMIEDDNGNLWITTLNGGVNKFDLTTERFTRYRHDPDNPNSLSGDRVLSVTQDSHGYLWFGTEFSGLNKFDPATETFTRYRNDSEGQFVDRITYIIEDSQGDIWFVGNGGLHHMDPQTEQITRPPATIGHVQADHIAEDEVGNLWMVSWSPNALVKYNPRSEQLTEYLLDEAILGGLSSNLLSDGQNGFWVPSREGLYYFDRQTEQFVHLFQHDETKPESLNDNYVVSIFQDKAGLLWVGTAVSGLNILNFQQQQFGYYGHSPADPNTLSPGTVTEIYEDSSGILWVGFLPRALDRIDRSTGQITHYVPDLEDANSLSAGPNLYGIYKDADGYIWLGGWDSGLDRLDERTGQFKHYQHNPDDSNSLIANHVLSIFEDRSSNLWLGQHGGLSRFDPDTEQFTNYLPNPDDPTSLGHTAVRVIYQDHAGTLWLGLSGGVLSRFDDKTETFVNIMPDSRDPNSLKGGTILALHEDHNGTLWVGATDGLYRFHQNNGSFTHYTDIQGLPSSNIQGILEDDTGKLWISTRNGVSRFDPQTETFRNYDAYDGLQSNDFSSRCYAQGQNGEMFFGGSKGFNAFFPANIQDNPYVPPVVLTDFKIFNKPVSIGDDSVLQQAIPYVDALTLSYQDAIFSFEFAALSYANPAKNRYRYKLEGFEPDWNEVDSKQRLAIYTNLNPGNYVFRVQGSNNDGFWNEEGVSLPITITPPWWQLWWIRTLMLMLVVGAITGIFVWQRQSARRHQRILETLITERTSELEVANKELEAFAYSVSHDLRAPLRHIDGFVEMLQGNKNVTFDDKSLHYIEFISDSAKKMGTLIDDLLSFSRMGRSELSKLPVDIGVLVQGIIKDLEPEIVNRDIHWKISEFPIITGDRAMLEVVFSNLISNALKFTRSRIQAKIEIGCILDETEFIFFVRDNGVGFDMKYVDKLFGVFQRLHKDDEFEGTGIGLANVQRVINRHGGRTWAEGKVDQGATFYFSLPESGKGD